MSAALGLLSAAIVPLLLSTLSAIACYLSAGHSLGAFLGPLILVTLLVPAVTVSADTLIMRLTLLAATLLPFWVIWLYITIASQLPDDPTQYTRISEWLSCCIILSAYALALSALSAALRQIRLPPLASAAIVTVLGLSWLTWPIYTSRTWQGSDTADTIAPFIAAHPAFAINGQLHRQFGLWTEQSIAYHLTDLGQNVPFILPRSIWPTILIHGLIGGALFAASALIARKSKAPPPSPTALPPS